MKLKPADSARAHAASLFPRRRPLFWFALAVCAGIFFDDFTAPSLTISLLACASILAVGVFMVVFAPRGPRFAAACAAAFALGASYHALEFREPPSDDISRLTPPRPCVVWLRGTIQEAEWKDDAEPQAFPATHWIVAVSALGRDESSAQHARGKLRLTVRLDIDAEPLAEGDSIAARVRLEPLPASTLPSGFDYGAYLAARGVSRMGSASRKEIEHIASPRWWNGGLWLRRLSGVLSLRTRELLDGSSEQAGLLNAMLFGRRESLSAADRESFSINGTAHLLAISGLHVQLIGWAFFRLLSYFGLPRRKAGLWVLGLSIMYCLLTGSSPPAVRATVMLAAYVGSAVFWRNADPLNTLAAAALACLAIAPHDLFTAGFQLSFLAVLSLATIRPALEEAWDEMTHRHDKLQKLLDDLEANRSQDAAAALRESWFSKLREKLRQGLFISIAAWLATSPAVAWHMGRIPTYGLLINVVAVFLLAWCMASGFLTMLVGIIWPAAGKLLGFVTLLLLTMLEKFNAACAALPVSSLDTPRPAVWRLLVFTALLIFIWLRRRQPKRVFGTGIPLLAAVLLLVSTAWTFEHPAGPELWIYDVRGQAALFRTPTGAAMVDAGAPGQGARLAESLRRNGIRRLDVLVITSDEPHAIGGALDLARATQPARVILPRARMPSEMRRELERELTTRGIPYSSPKDGESIDAPSGASWTFVSDGPPEDKPAAPASTLFARVECGTFSALIAEAKSAASFERLFAKANLKLNAKIVRLIPGAQKRWPKEAEELLRRTAPELLIAGTDSSPEELPGLDFDSMTFPLLVPKREGTLRVSPDQKEFKVEAYKNGWRGIELESNSE